MIRIQFLFILKALITSKRNYTEALTNNEALYTSTISVYQVSSGFYHRDAKKQLEKFSDLLSMMEILNLDELSIETSARIYSRLRKQGLPIGDLDLLIAGIAMRHGLKLISNNLREFKRIKELKVESWLQD